jgi:hypothetical protein
MAGSIDKPLVGQDNPMFYPDYKREKACCNLIGYFFSQSDFRYFLSYSKGTTRSYLGPPEVYRCYLLFSKDKPMFHPDHKREQVSCNPIDSNKGSIRLYLACSLLQLGRNMRLSLPNKR